MAIKPLLDKVLLKSNEGNEKTQSGILLTGKSKEEPAIAEVIACGPGGIVDGKEVKMHVSPGDKVIINKYSGTEITYKNEKYIIVSQREILALVLG
ncbi:MAG: co-chaperone GroES [Candidatus Improbicoccus pseudotrichonymphae]|uniref:Co-chaperonin GroES n=1 Tax=Candidatus Improbicoccus pseudotrichonymphae TaxID=3033792 RepID=A0AA48KWV5_9FIRM|nr:MAG: co-chaperone GroES [Candidatus Improbicoccus pseudotrichonymphae]